MIRLCIARHGEPAWYEEGRAVDEPALTPQGRLEALALRDRLAGRAFDLFCVSPLRRARETARPLEEALGVEARVCDWLAELGQPPFQGRPWEEVKQAYLQALARPPAAWWDGMPGGEPFRDFQRRVTTGLEGLLAQACGAAVRQVDGHRLWSIPPGDGSLLFVCHGGTAAVLLAHLLDLGMVPWAYERMPLGYGGCATLQTRDLSVGQVWTLTGFEGSAGPT